MRWLPTKIRDLLIAERVVVAVILVNTAAMTLAGFFAEGTVERRLLDAIDYVCVVFFVVEVICKVWRWGWKGYISVGWNRFDFLVTILCLPVLFAPLLHTTARLGWVPLFRATRLFRLFRLLRFIPEVDHLVVGVRRALRASVGVFLALLLLNLVFSLMASFLFHEIAPDLFGDPAQSFYSIFRVFTIEGWHEIPEILAERVGDPTWAMGIRLFFMLTVVVGGVLGLSLANAVFIDEMTMDNNRHLEQQVADLTAEVRALRGELAAALGAGRGERAPPVELSEP